MAGALAIVIFLLFGSAAEAQEWDLGGAVARPVPGVGHDYIHMLGETVNPATGSLSLRFNLPVPKGRGLTLPIAIAYDSGEVHGASKGDVGPAGWDNGHITNRAQAGHGWSDTIPYATATFNTANVWIMSSGQPANAGTCPISTFYNFYDPGGASHMLQLTAIGAYYPYNVFPQPATAPCQQASIAGSGPYFAQPYYSSRASGGDELVSASMDNCDGSNTATTPSDCSNGTPAFTVSDQDATYHFAADSFGSRGALGIYGIIYPSTIEDRNGNVITFEKVFNSNTATLPITDTLGRPAVSIAYSGDTTYTVGGLNYVVGNTTTGASFTATALNISPYGTRCDDFQPAVSESYSVVGSIKLPNEQSYTFGYDQNGMVNQVTYPGGGWVQYTWAVSTDQQARVTFGGSPGPCNYLYHTLVITDRAVGYGSGQAAALKQHFTYTTQWGSNNSPYWTVKTTKVDTTDMITGQASSVSYTYTPTTLPLVSNAPGQYDSQVPVEQGAQYFDSRKLVKTVNETWYNPYNMTSQQVVLPSGLSSEVVTCYYEGSTDIAERDEYGFGVTGPSASALTTPSSGGTPYPIYPTCGTPTPTSRTVYGPYFAKNRPCQTIVYDSQGSRAAETDVYFDNAASACQYGPGGTAAVSPLPPAGTFNGTTSGAHGNPTRVVKWLNTGASITTSATYDETGQVTSTTDACGAGSCSDMSGTNHTTTYSYTDSPAGGNTAGNSNAYLTKVTDPLGHFETFTYNYSTGQLVSLTDQNRQTTSYKYIDPLNRQTETDYPGGGETTIAYDDSVPSITTSTLLGNNQWKTSVATMDGMGHITQRKSTSDPDGTDFVDTSYDGTGSVYTMSNPYRGTAPVPGDTTTFYHDALGRKIQQIQQDGSKLEWCYDGVTSNPAVANCTGKLGASAAQRTFVNFADEVGNQWQRSYDSFGRIVEVMESNGSTKTPTLETDYSYSVLNDLIGVNQLGAATETPRSRTFTYDSLSRLLCASNPENSQNACPQNATSKMPSGVVTYGYDSNGNLSAKTDARGVTTSYLYDPLNRLSQKTYLGDPHNTPSSCYEYDSAAGNAIGRLTNEWTQAGSCPVVPPTSPQSLRTILAYDAVGRVTQEQRCTGKRCTEQVYRPMSFSYDLAGNPTGSGDGRAGSSARSFITDYDVAGRLLDLTEAGSATVLFSVQSYSPVGWSVATIGSQMSASRSYDNRTRVMGETVSNIR